MRFHVWLHPILATLAFLFFSTVSFAQVAVGVSVGFAPPELPVYEQPICPGDGYIWTPGYWAWDGEDYYWVPGTWVLAPEVGYFWTPPYWGWGGSAFVFHAGYWGPQVGFYGGVNYGYGYTGRGYEGGRWDNGHFFYNRSVNNVNVTVVHNVYNTRVVNVSESRVSYNGGHGGIDARPTSQEEAAARERHVPPVAAQDQHVQQARSDPQFRASENHGKPPIAATPKPADFNERGVTHATSSGTYKPPARTANNAPHNNAPSSAPRTAVHPNDLPAHQHAAAPNTGNPKTDQKYQQQQEKLYSKQQQEHQKLQQKQDQEHQKLAKQQASEAQKQQMEQRHQQQTQQMEQKHAQQQEKMNQHQQPHQAPPPQHQEPPKQKP